MSSDTSKHGLWLLLTAIALILLVPGLLLVLLVYKPFTPLTQTILYSLLALVVVAGYSLQFIEFTAETINVVRKNGIIKTTLLSAIVCTAALLAGFGWSSRKAIIKPNTTDPTSQTEATLDRIYHVLKSIRTKQKKSPTNKNMAVFLSLFSGDPNNLAEHYDQSKEAFIDAWGNLIVYEQGAFNQVSLLSCGANGVNEQGEGDDIVRGDLIVVDLNPKDKIIDGVKGLFNRDKDEEPSDSEGN